MSELEVKQFQVIIGIIFCMVNSTRPDAYYSYWICSKRCINPRVWDMHCLVWVMEYIDSPLVLGGPVLKTELMSDASFATLPPVRSVCGRFCRTGPKSGCVFAHICSQAKNQWLSCLPRVRRVRRGPTLIMS